MTEIAPSIADRLGGSVEHAAGSTLVGAPGHDSDAGKVVVFDSVAGAWTESSEIEHPSPSAQDGFGSSLAHINGLIAVGAPGDEIGIVADAGSIQIFQSSLGGISHLIEVPNPSPAINDNFGHAVSLTFDAAADEFLLIAGSPYSEVGSTTDAGRSFIFSAPASSPTAWTLEATLEALSPEANERFGWSVSISSDVVVVGAPLAAESGPGLRGAAYVFDRNPDGSWNTVGTELLSPSPRDGAEFGYAVDVSGDLVAIGAPFALEESCGVGGTNVLGTVDVFRRTASGWTLEETIVPSRCTDRQRFGHSLDLEGSVLLVGEPGDTGDPSGFGDEGRAYRFGRVGSAWIEVEQLDPDGGSFVWGTPPATGAAVVLGTDPATGASLLVAGGPSYWDVSGLDESGSLRLMTFSSPGPGDDCDGDGVSDACAIAQHPELDCNGNGQLDSCDLDQQISNDCNADGVPDECQPDCDGDSIPDDCEIAQDPSIDCDLDGVPDDCLLPNTPVEIVWVVDRTHVSLTPTDAALCTFIDQVVSLVGSGPNPIPITSTVAVIESGLDTPLPCQEPEDVITRYGAEVPDAAACCQTLDDTLQWAGAAAIVSRRHPWTAPVRIVAVVGATCGWDGDDTTVPCDSDDADAVAAAACVLEADGVFGFVLNTKFSSEDERALLQSFAEETLGYWHPLVSEDLLGQAPVIATEIERRERLLDSDSNGVIDACELVVSDDPAALTDCNDNGIADAFEIELDLADGLDVARLDMGGNGRIDACESATCVGELDGNGLVDFEDLLLLLAAWGDCPAPPDPCPADFDGDDLVGFNDLVLMLAGWGWCPVPADPCRPALGATYSAPSSIWDCYNQTGGDPEKLAACIEAMMLNGTP